MTTWTCSHGRPIPDEYVELAKRTNATWPLRRVSAALRDYELDHRHAVPEIARRHLIPVRTLRDYVRRTGMPRRDQTNLTRQVSDAELQRTVDLVRELGTQALAAQALGLHQTTVGARLDRAGHRSTRTTTRNA